MLFDGWTVAELAALFVMSWTVLPLLRADYWLVRAFDFPRVQILCLTLTTLLLYLAMAFSGHLLEYLVVAGLVTCASYQAARILPYTPLFPKRAHDRRRGASTDAIGVLVANVLMTNRDADRLRRLVLEQAPDIVLTLESDAWWEAQLAPLSQHYPHRVSQAQDNLYGMHLYSKLPLENAAVAFLVEDDVPSIQARVVLASGHRVTLYCLHPRPPSPSENLQATERDAELLIVARRIDGADCSVIVLGDLNDVAWSATTRLFSRISGLLDVRVGRGMFSTYNAKYPLLRWPLDHIFCSADFTVGTMRRLPPIGSDHFPIFAELVRQPVVRQAHDVPSADADDEARATEKIAAAL